FTVNLQGQTVTLPENINTFSWDTMPENSKLNGGHYGWVQFYETPVQQVQDLFKANNLQLIDYIPNKTYLFRFPEGTPVAFLEENGVRSIVPVEWQYKVTSGLRNGDIPYYAKDGENILVTLLHHGGVSSEYIVNDLAAKQITINQNYLGAQTLALSIPNNCLQNLAEQPYVRFIELIDAPPVKDDKRGRSLHRASNIDTQTISGLNYTGRGIGVLVRDDGIVGPHIDFEGRIDNTFASGTGQTHGDGVAGIMAGAGNLDPTNRGMAAGSNLFVCNYVSNFLDNATTTLTNNGSVQITNSSYSNGCNAGYTSTTRTVDLQAHTNTSLLHVFSAGNSNNNNCGYGAGSQWGNITGGHKQGKNVIATANVFFNGNLVNSSSRGPGYDGRIKPDITANGQNQISTSENNNYLTFGGTSGAAPGIAGVSAQLYELYGTLNNGALPQAALIKATLLNTANDYGNVGPDFRFGWGLVNARRAANALLAENHLMDEISQGENNTHTIDVPAGTSQVRFMLYWNDPNAAANAATALINDLDLVVTDPNSNNLLPYILNPAPNPVTLNDPATNGIDRLNNMEQVLINAPDAGTYTLNIEGFNVPMGPQEYFIVYEIIQDQLVLTYPKGGEKLVTGTQETIH
ncbi:MAG: S8 family serine peptidase, partial [Marinirhabdus sp.]